MVTMSATDFKKLLKMYWNAGMNNAYWDYLEKNVSADIKKYKVTK